MDINIKIELDGKKDSKGLMGVSLEEIQKTVIKKKKKKKKSALMKAVESAIPYKSEYTTEIV
jgi:hypothetical protein